MRRSTDSVVTYPPSAFDELLRDLSPLLLDGHDDGRLGLDPVVAVDLLGDRASEPRLVRLCALATSRVAPLTFRPWARAASISGSTSMRGYQASRNPTQRSPRSA
jgi:hypothetical protein